jgi:uncharacterized membrane protein
MSGGQSTNVVFEGFVVPDPLYTAVLLVATGAVAALLYAIRPSVEQRTVVALVPWMVGGALLHSLYQLHLAVGETFLPAVLAPALSAPAVYLTTFVVLGVVWVGAAMVVPAPDRYNRVSRTIGVAGTTLVVTLGTLAVWRANQTFDLQPVLPVLGLVGSLVVTFLLYVTIGFYRTRIVEQAGSAGAVVLFAHTFDALTTAIGIELLDVEERSTIPRRVMEFAADLPTADLLGEAWLFVLLKLVVAAAVVTLFADYAADEPTEGNLFFAGIAAVGLGPGAQNFVLFALGVGG